MEDTDYNEKLRKFRNELYTHREHLININNRTTFGHPITTSSIKVYESVIKRLEDLFPELNEQPEIQKIK